MALWDPGTGGPSRTTGSPSRIQIAEVVAAYADGTIDAKLLTSRATKVGVEYPRWWSPAIGERCLLADRDGDPQNPICLGFFAPADGGVAPPATLFPGGASTSDASTTIKGVTKLSVAPAAPAAPIAVGDNDPRNSNARTPTAHAHPESDVTNLVADLAARELTANKGVAGGYAPLDGSGLVPSVNLLVTNASIAAAAAIAYSKLALANSIVNGDIATAAAIAYSKLNLAASIVAGDIAASLKPSGTAAAATEALRALGTTASTAAAGNDSRIVGAEQTTNKGAANGYAPLDGTSKVPLANLPALPPTNATGTFALRPAAASTNLGELYLVADVIFPSGGGGLTFPSSGAGLTFGLHDGELYESDGAGWSLTGPSSSDPRLPTPTQGGALVGTSGSPSATNPYVTNSDSRLFAAASANSAAGAILFAAAGTGATFPAGGSGLTFAAQVPQGKYLASDGAGGIEWTDGPTRQEFDQLEGRVDVPRFEPVYTALPTTGLVEGMVIHFLADAARPTIWELRYSPSVSPTLPWLPVGSPSLIQVVDPSFSIVGTTTTVDTTNGWSDLTSATVGPDVTVPLAGDYDVEYGYHGAYNLTTGLYVWMSIQVGAASLSATLGNDRIENNAAVGGTPMSGHGMRSKTGLAASTLIRAKYAVSSASTGSFRSGRYLKVTPVRLG